MSIQGLSTGSGTLVTADEVQSMSGRPGVQYEINEGKLTEVPGASLAHHLIVMAIVRLLDDFVTEQGLGYVFPDGLAYLLQRDPDVLRIPDASFISNESMAQISDLEGYWHGAPDLAVEVISPNDNAYELHDKVQQYLEAGVSAVWVIWPARRSVSVHFDRRQSLEVFDHGLLDGGDVLPGFTTPVAAMFDHPPSILADKQMSEEKE